MTDKERLEEIRAEVEQMTYTSPLNFEKTRIKKESALWLMEKLEELKLEINDLRAEAQKWQRFYKESEESHLETKELLHSTISEIKRYKQALEFYADPMIWREGNRIKDNTFEMPLANNDNGHKARKALEGRDNE